MNAEHSSTSWLSVAAVGIGAFVLVTTEFLPVGLLPQVAEEFGISEGQTGLMVTLPGLFAAVTAPLTSLWARAFDKRQVLCVLMALLALSNIVVVFASDLWMLLLGRALLGIAVGGFWTIGGTLGPRLKPLQPARATSMIFSGVSLGTVAGVPAGTILGELTGWRTVFGVSAALSVVVMLLLLRTLPTLPAQLAQEFRH
ncbi:MFS transporter [Pseudomonas sp. D2-30]|uniref:MFS transporter n=1 Tax=unclassified Pseudomonas TaxID=196821 RepID=UPI003DA88C95